MDVVVDANVIIAALISPQGYTADLFFTSPLRIFAPASLFDEIKEHKDELLQKTGLSEFDFDAAFSLLGARVIFFPFTEFLSFIPHAEVISPDPDDVEYLALALKRGCPLWSNDKELKRQTAVSVVSTSELMRLVH